MLCSQVPENTETGLQVKNPDVLRFPFLSACPQKLSCLTLEVTCAITYSVFWLVHKLVPQTI